MIQILDQNDKAQIEQKIKTVSDETNSLKEDIKKGSLNRGSVSLDKLKDFTGVIDMVKQITPVENKAIKVNNIVDLEGGAYVEIPVDPEDSVILYMRSLEGTVGQYYKAQWVNEQNGVISSFDYGSTYDVGIHRTLTAPDGAYFLRINIRAESYKPDLSIFVNPVDSISNEKIETLYGLRMGSSVEFDTFLNNSIKEINPLFNYKGHISGDELPLLLEAKKYDCYFYDGDRLMEIYDDVIYPGDLIYSLGSYGRWKKAVFPYKKQSDVIQNYKYDICIVGGGAAGIGAAYALKDSGFSVCLIEELNSLGGTHCNAGVIEILPSPAPDFFKEICKEAYNNGLFFTFDRSNYKVGSEEESEFDKLWRGSEINYGIKSGEWGNYFRINPRYMSQKYNSDLREKIDIFFNKKLVDQKTVGGVCESIAIQDLETGRNITIWADYFIDCTGGGELCKKGKTLDNDFYIGADPLTLYNESAIKSEFNGNHYEINSLEPTYMFSGINGNIIDYQDPSYRPVDGISGAKNNKWVIPYYLGARNTTGGTWFKKDPIADGYYKSGITIVSPDYHAGLTAADLIDRGYDYTYVKGKNCAAAHFIKSNGENSKKNFMGSMPLLAIRESYRIKCDHMLTQSDIETLATSANIVENQYIALSSWYCDVHNPVSIDTSKITYRQLFGIPYGSIVPSAYKNVLIACRGFGASHIAAAASRLTKTMMSLGYAAGKAIWQCRENWLEDVRNINVSRLQTDCGVIDKIEDLEKNFTLK